MSKLYSLVESAGHPNFSLLYRELGLEEERFSSMRKLLAAVKRNPPDFIVAEFFYGYSNDYAGITISNLDVLLYSLQKYAPGCRCIVLVAKEERQYVDQLQDIFPLHEVLVEPVREKEMRLALEHHR